MAHFIFPVSHLFIWMAIVLRGQKVELMGNSHFQNAQMPFTLEEEGYSS